MTKAPSTKPSVELLRFLTDKEVESLCSNWGTPLFVYDEATLIKQAQAALNFPAPYGLTVRYAMKANPHSYIISLFNKQGIKIDASSGYEAERAIISGIKPNCVLLTSQELPHNLAELVNQGMQFNACSVNQLEVYGKLFPGSSVGVRINPGVGSGSTKKTDVGGETSSFGIWHNKVDDVLQLSRKYNLTINRLHTHIGSGGDPLVWAKVAETSLQLAAKFPEVRILNLGGGFKVGRMHNEHTADLQLIGQQVKSSLTNFYKVTGRKLSLEIEPGAFLAANAGALLTTVQDITDTGTDGYDFLKLDAGMTEILRPSFYGIHHPIVVASAENRGYQKYTVVGHCCEAGDILTPSDSDQDNTVLIGQRLLHTAKIGDRVVIEGAGAYCASMSAHNYNSFPLPVAVVRKLDGSVNQISKRQTIDQMLELETA